MKKRLRIHTTLLFAFLISLSLATSFRTTDCPSHCISCRDSVTCVDCKSEYFLNLTAACQKCSDSCKECSKNPTYCTKCSSFMSLNSDNSCSLNFFSPTFVCLAIILLIFIISIVLIVFLFHKQTKNRKI